MTSYSTNRTTGRKSQHRKTRSRNKRRGKQRGFPWAATLGGIAAIGALAGGGYAVWQDMQRAKPDENSCYSQVAPQPITAALIDVSLPGFDPVQGRDAITAFTNLFRYELTFNELFSLITTAESRIGSVSSPVVTLCGPARSAADLETVGAASATQAFLDRQADQAFEKQLAPHLSAIFGQDPADEDRQRHESPILEQIQSVSRMQGFSNPAARRRLILVSDMIQNTREAQFCVTQGHLPRFETFKNQPYFQQVRPTSLSGVDVTIYMLIRGDLGSPPYAFCTETELAAFWTDYFTDAGASHVEIIRLRQGTGP